MIIKEKENTFPNQIEFLITNSIIGLFKSKQFDNKMQCGQLVLLGQTALFLLAI
jgi:hypothetical protein